MAHPVPMSLIIVFPVTSRLTSHASTNLSSRKKTISILYNIVSVIQTNTQYNHTYGMFYNSNNSNNLNCNDELKTSLIVAFIANTG